MRLNRLAIIGLGLAVAGVFLAVGFWQLTSVSGARLLASYAGGRYSGYVAGSRITIHERILGVNYSNFPAPQYTFLELDDGNPDVTTGIFVRGDARGVASPGDVVFASAVLQETQISGLKFQYWEVATPGDVHQSWPVDAAFYGVMGAGVAVLIVAAFRKP